MLAMFPKAVLIVVRDLSKYCENYAAYLFRRELLKGEATRHNDSLSQGFGVGNEALSGSGDARKSRNNWLRSNSGDADTSAIADDLFYVFSCGK